MRRCRFVPFLLFCLLPLCTGTAGAKDCLNTSNALQAAVDNGALQLKIAQNLLKKGEGVESVIKKWFQDVCEDDASYNVDEDGCVVLVCASSVSPSDAKLVSGTQSREQSWQNQLLSSASMGMTGAGGMELLSGLSEQKSDAAADSDMQAYLATFRCEYGNTIVNAGNQNIELDGGNVLFNLYQEYVDVASNLKELKQALNLAPGIESQVIMNKANTALYDDSNTGIENGTFASLYRASRGNQDDLDKLQAQRDASANKIKLGAGLAIGGIAIGLVGNVIENAYFEEDETFQDAIFDEDTGECIANCHDGRVPNMYSTQRASDKNMRKLIRNLSRK